MTNVEELGEIKFRRGIFLADSVSIDVSEKDFSGTRITFFHLHLFDRQIVGVACCPPLGQRKRDKPDSLQLFLSQLPGKNGLLPMEVYAVNSSVRQITTCPSTAAREEKINTQREELAQ
ncbi:hypothetical protein L345_14103, partial [Ophiophagus hannah]